MIIITTSHSKVSRHFFVIIQIKSKLSTKGPKAPRPQNERKIISSMVQQEGRGNPTHYAQMDEQEREATILGYADTWRLVVQQQLYKQKESWLVHTILCRSFLYTRQRGMSMVLLGRKKTQFLLFSAHCMVSRFCFDIFAPSILQILRMNWTCSRKNLI